MPIILDQETVQTEFTQTIPADISAPMRAHITGPEAVLHRYDIAAEKEEISLGSYDYAANTTYDYPGKTAGSIVDLDYVSVRIDNALLRYFRDLAGSGSTVTPVANYTNRVKYNGANGFKANGDTYPRLASLKDRDVTIGDVVKITSGNVTLTSYVAGLVADQVAADVGAATSDASNAIAQPSSYPGSAPTFNASGGGANGGNLTNGTYIARYSFTGAFGETSASAGSANITISGGNIPRLTIPALPAGATSARIYLSNGTASNATLYKTGVTTTTTDLNTVYNNNGTAVPEAISQISGTSNNISAAISVGSYNGAATGDITETYTITVIQAPTVADDATTAKLQVTSASGRDDVASVTPAAYGAATTIGTRGVTVTFSTASSDDFVLGQTWRATVRQAWEVPDPTSNGTYTGTQDATYIVTVSRGGLFSDSTLPQISTSVDKGFDSSGPTTVTDADVETVVGSLGVTVSFSGSGLRKGDIYYVPVTAVSDGAYKTIALGHNLPDALAEASDLDLTLYIKKNIVVPAQRASSPPDLNWTADQDGLTINAGVDAYDSTLTDSGAQFAVPVEGGDVYAVYREWVSAHAGALHEVASEAALAAEFGFTSVDDIHPDHELAYGVLKAVQNSNGQTVKFSGVADPSNQDDWDEVLALLAGYNDIFSLVPLTRDEPVLSAFKTHIVDRSDDNEAGGEWRHGWFNLAAQESVAIVDAALTSDHAVAMATLADNPATSGTQYTLVAVTSGNVNFVTDGVAAGDIFRYIYGVDAFGEETYTSFVIESVVNAETLVLESGNEIAISTPQRFEVWRTLSRNQIAENLTEQMTGDNLNKRFKFVWPDQITDDKGRVVDGFFLCAAYAGYVSGIAPHQGVRNLAISGFTSTPRSNSFFNNGQLNSLGAAGFFVVATAPTGEVYAKFAKTPDLSSVDTSEEAMPRRDDAIRYLIWNRAAQYQGTSNLNAAAIAIVKNEVQAAIQHGVSDTVIDRLGPLLTSGTIVSIAPHATAPDRLVVVVSADRSRPYNTTDLVISF